MITLTAGKGRNGFGIIRDERGRVIAKGIPNKLETVLAASLVMRDALHEVSNAANVCAARDEANQDYWLKIQKRVNEAIRAAGEPNT